MNKNYIPIIIFLWCSLLWASPTTTSFEDSRTSNFEFFSISKDTLNPTEKDTTKTKKPNAAYLSQLQQMAQIRSGIGFYNTSSGTPLKSPQGDIRNDAAVEVEKTFRSFPSLDEKLAENKSFNVSFVNREPEFTDEFIKANFDNNPAVDKLITNAKNALDAVKELGAFVDIITGNELLELPVGLKKQDKTSGNTVELAISEVKFTPGYALLTIWARLTIPEKGELKEGETRGVERELFFGAQDVKLTHDGGLSGDMKLVLLGNQAIPIQGDNWLLTLKGGINLKTGEFSNKSFIEFSCSDLKGISLEGDLRVSRNVLLPIDAEGNYTCGDSASNQFSDNENTIIDNKCYVGTSFQASAEGWNDIFLTVNLPRFEVVGLKGWGFNMQNITMDFSDSRSAENMVLPTDYNNIYSGSDRTLWRGFYAQEVSVMLPKGIENTKKSNGRVEFGAKNLVLDSQGVSGTFFAENVLQKGDGAAGKWAFTIEDVSISLSQNRLTGGSIGGDIAVPIFEEPMDYSGYIAQNGYGLEVGLQKDYTTPVFLGEMQLERNSSVAINVKNGNVYPYANLTGKLAIAGKINQKADENPNPEDKNGFAFNGISFQELELQTEPGKKSIQAKAFGFEGEMKLMNFPASIGNLQLVTPSNQVGLSFDLKINLDDSGSHATTSLDILGKLDEGAKIQEWKFEKVKVDGIEIDYKKSGFAIKGGLKVMEDDPTYGDGFSGELKATFEQLNFSATGRAMFGKTDFRYWFVDIWSESLEGGGESKLPIKSFVGGVSQKMRKVSGNSTGFEPGSAVYAPDKDTGLGVRAGVKITTENADAFSGKAYLEMEFNTHGGLNRIGFMGEGAFMSGESGAGGDSTKEVAGVFGKINDYVEKNKDKADELSKYGNFLGLSKEAIPVRDVAASGAIGVYVGIEKDFVNGTFDGEFELYMDLKGVKGGGENNLAGYAKIHTGPEDWYLYIGTPQQRIELLFKVGVQLRVGGYFMTGTKLPSQLDPHPIVVKILGDDMLNGDRKENQLTAGKGFAFGMNFGYGYGFDWGIFYAFVELGAGFDVMHAYYPNAKCVGRPGPIGNDGWYSMGQVYAYLYGEFGVKVNLAFIKGNFVIAEAGVAAVLRGQFPNPAYVQGYVGMYYKILGGLVSGRMRLKVEVGEECELENIGNAVGVPIISDVTPADKAPKVSVHAAPQAVFNYAVNKDFTVNYDGKRSTYKIQLKDFKVISEGKELVGDIEWNDTNDAVTFVPFDILPSEKDVQVLVEVSFDEKIGSSYQTMMSEGKLVTEKREITFTTDKAPDYIEWGNVVYTYPVKEQLNFYPEEYDKGYVQLKSGRPDLFNNGYQMRAEIASSTGVIRRTDLSYNPSNKRIVFSVPEMFLNTDYKINLMAFPPGQEIKPEIIVENTETVFDEEAGDTNWYNVDNDSQGKETVNVSGNVVVANKKASSVTIANGKPKSILDYTYKTSIHNTFKNKVQSLSVTNYITDIITEDVHAIHLKLAKYENFEVSEVLGSKYTGGISMIYGEAVLNDRYYKKDIFPIAYDGYPIDGIEVNRDPEIFDVPPVKSMPVPNWYEFYLKNQPDNPYVTNRYPIIYNLPQIYRDDFINTKLTLKLRYEANEDPLYYNKYKHIISAERFPALKKEKYDTRLIFRTPGNIHTSSAPMRFERVF